MTKWKDIHGNPLDNEQIKNLVYCKIIQVIPLYSSDLIKWEYTIPFGEVYARFVITYENGVTVQTPPFKDYLITNLLKILGDGFDWELDLNNDSLTDSINEVIKKLAKYKADLEDQYAFTLDEILKSKESIQEYLKSLNYITSEKLSQILSLKHLTLELIDAIVEWLNTGNDGNPIDLTTYIDANTIVTSRFIANSIFSGKINANSIVTGTLNANNILVRGLEVGKNVTMGPNASISWNLVLDKSSVVTSDKLKSLLADEGLTTDLINEHITNVLKEAGVIDENGAINTPELSEYLKKSEYDSLQVANWLNSLTPGSLNTYIDANTLITSDIISLKILTGSISASLIKTSELVVGENIRMGDNATLSWGKITGTSNVITKDNLEDALDEGGYLNLDGYYSDANVVNKLKELGILDQDGNVVLSNLAGYLKSSDVDAALITTWLAKGDKPDLTTYIDKNSIITETLGAGQAFLGTVYAGNILMGTTDNTKIFIDGGDGTIKLGDNVKISWDNSWNSKVAAAAGTYDDSDIINRLNALEEIDVIQTLKDAGILDSNGNVISSELSKYIKSEDFNLGVLNQLLATNPDLTTYIDGNSIVTHYLTANKINARLIDVSGLYVGTNGIRLDSSAVIQWGNLSEESRNNLKGKDGTEWTIGDDGYWYKNGVKTLVKAEGSDGTSIVMKASAAECISIGDGYIDDNGHLLILIQLSPKQFKDCGTIKGPLGDPGKDATLYYTHIVYVDDLSGTNYSTNSARDYMGVYVDTISDDAGTFLAANNKSGIIWSKIKGEKGDDGVKGDDGIYVTSVMQKYLWTTASSVTKNTPGWSTTLGSGTGNLWEMTVYTWSDGTTTYTTPSKNAYAERLGTFTTYIGETGLYTGTVAALNVIIGNNLRVGDAFTVSGDSITLGDNVSINWNNLTEDTLNKVDKPLYRLKIDRPVIIKNSNDLKLTAFAEKIDSSGITTLDPNDYKILYSTEKYPGSVGGGGEELSLEGYSIPSTLNASSLHLSLFKKEGDQYKLVDKGKVALETAPVYAPVVAANGDLTWVLNGTPSQNVNLKGDSIKEQTLHIAVRRGADEPSAPTSIVTTNNPDVYEQWNLAIPNVNKEYTDYYTCYLTITIKADGSLTGTWSSVLEDTSSFVSMLADPSKPLTTYIDASTLITNDIISNLVFTGEVHANSGTIGGWSISENAIKYDEGSVDDDYLISTVLSHGELLFREWSSDEAHRLVIDTNGLYCCEEVNMQSKNPVLRINLDGSGYLANRNFSWGVDGTVSLGKTDEGWNTELTSDGILKTLNIEASGGSIGGWEILGNCLRNDDRPESLKNDPDTNYSEISLDSSLNVIITRIVHGGEYVYETRLSPFGIGGGEVSNDYDSWAIKSDGSGYFANKNFSWDTNGAIEKLIVAKPESNNQLACRAIISPSDGIKLTTSTDTPNSMYFNIYKNYKLLNDGAFGSKDDAVTNFPLLTVEYNGETYILDPSAFIKVTNIRTATLTDTFVLTGGINKLISEQKVITEGPIEVAPSI